jgi:hypothetical protein
MISLFRFFHSPASPEDPPWARACKRRIKSGVMVGRLFSREDPIQCRPVSGQFLLRAVAGPGSSNHKRAQPIRGDGHAFDSIRRFGALDDRLLPQYFEDFRLLSDTEIQLSTRLHEPREKPTCADRDLHVGQFVGVERQFMHSLWGGSS